MEGPRLAGSWKEQQSTVEVQPLMLHCLVALRKFGAQAEGFLSTRTELKLAAPPERAAGVGDSHTVLVIPTEDSVKLLRQGA